MQFQSNATWVLKIEQIVFLNKILGEINEREKRKKEKQKRKWNWY